MSGVCHLHEQCECLGQVVHADVNQRLVDALETQALQLLYTRETQLGERAESQSMPCEMPHPNVYPTGASTAFTPQHHYIHLYIHPSIYVSIDHHDCGRTVTKESVMGLAVRFSGGLMPRRYQAITSGGASKSVRMDSSDQQ